jgi:hypothetical protein
MEMFRRNHQQQDLLKMNFLKAPVHWAIQRSVPFLPSKGEICSQGGRGKGAAAPAIGIAGPGAGAGVAVPAVDAFEDNSQLAQAH